MLENANLYVEALPLDAVEFSRETFGDFKTAPDNYFETYSLLGHGVYEFIGVAVNGAFYCKPAVQYDKNTAKLRINGLQLTASDRACFVFNKVFEKDFLVNFKKIELNNAEQIKDIHGDYQTDPDNYCEIYNMNGASAYDFVGININGMFYAHPDNIVFDKLTNRLTIKSLPLMNSDNIVLFYNAR